MPKDNPSKGPGAGKAATKKAAPAPRGKSENLKKRQAMSPEERKRRNSERKRLAYKKKGGNGGARKGAGNKLGNKAEVTIVKEALGEKYLAFGEEEIEIAVNSPKGQMIVRKARAIAALEKLFTKGMRDSGDTTALIAFLDRVGGKPRQSIDHSGSIATDEQEMPDTEADRAAERAFVEALRHEITEADDELDEDE